MTISSMCTSPISDESSTRRLSPHDSSPRCAASDTGWERDELVTAPSTTVRTLRPGTSLASRLMIGQLIVLLAGALTITALTVIIGPVVFHYHLLQTDLPVGSAELVHIERAYRDALALALGVGLVVSLLAAGFVTWNLARRLRQTLQGLTSTEIGRASSRRR